MTLDTRSIGREINDLLVLSTLREEPKHGYQIAHDVETESDGSFELQHGTLYPILHRLESEGLIEGSWTREGRRRKEYGLTRKGRRHLGEESGRMRSVFRKLTRMLGEEGDGTLRPRPAAG